MAVLKLPGRSSGQPTRLYLRLRYHSPDGTAAELDTPLGWRQGLAYSIDAEEGIINRCAPVSPPRVLDGARLYPLGADPMPCFCYPKGGLDEACLPRTRKQTAVLPPMITCAPGYTHGQPPRDVLYHLAQARTKGY